MKKIIFNKVAIIGTGLIGGSVALALKKKKICRKIVGVSRRKESLRLAKRLKAIDQGSQKIDIIRGADLIILATPVNNIIDSCEKIFKFAKSNCLICDVGSTKSQIVKKYTKFSSHFVGIHPLAGSEKRGIKNADANLFKNSISILTPVARTDKNAFKKIKRLWELLGSRVIIQSPKMHDKIMALLSHLPHLIAFSIVNSVPQKFLKISMPSFRDSTRVASSDPVIWKDIILSNKTNIIQAISVFEKNLAKIKKAIKKNDPKELELILKRAGEKKKRIG